MGTWVQVMSVWGNGFQIAKIDGPRIFMSEGREDVDITGFEGNIVISLSIVGPGDTTRTCDLLLPKQARYQLRNTRVFDLLLA